MPDPTEAEMMADLARADAAGDTALAQHIAGRIKALQPPQQEHGRLAEAAHKTAAFLPMAGGIAGGALGVGTAPATGPGAVLMAALGAGLLGGVGKSAQKAIDSALGYDNPTIMDTAKESALAGAGEAAGAAGGSVLGAGIAAAAKPLSGPLRNLATTTTRRILRNTGGSLSSAKPLSTEAAQEALDMGIIKPFGTSRGAAQRLETAREATGDAYGKIVAALEARGIKGPDAQMLAQKLSAEGAAVDSGTINSGVTGAYESAAKQVGNKTTGDLGLSQAESLKRSAQDMASSAYKQMQPGEVGRAHEDIASMMRQAVEDAIARQTAPMVISPETKAIAAQFEPIKQQAGRLIEASNVARQGVARAANRNAVSPLDWMMTAGEFAHSGNPIRAAAIGAGTHLLRTRGPSTAAVAADAMANRLEDPGSRLLTILGAGGGGAAGPKLLDILAQLRKNRSETPDVP